MGEADKTSEGKGSTTFPVATDDGIVDVEKKVSLDGSAVVMEAEDGAMFQSQAGAQVKDVEGAAPMNSSNTSGDVDATFPDDNSDAVKRVEEAVTEATGTRATLTASEAANVTGQPMSDEAIDAGMDAAEAAAEAPADEAPAEDAEASDAPEATPAAEAKAEELGVDLSKVEGSGADGNILVSDVEAAAEEA